MRQQTRVSAAYGKAVLKSSGAEVVRGSGVLQEKVNQVSKEALGIKARLEKLEKDNQKALLQRVQHFPAPFPPLFLLRNQCKTRVDWHRAGYCRISTCANPKLKEYCTLCFVQCFVADLDLRAADSAFQCWAPTSHSMHQLFSARW